MQLEGSIFKDGKGQRMPPIALSVELTRREALLLARTLGDIGKRVETDLKHELRGDLEPDWPKVQSVPGWDEPSYE